MTKDELVAAVWEEVDYALEKSDCAIVVNAMLKVTIDALLRGETVYYTDLGTFSIGGYKACTKPNPHTGALEEFPARRTLKFKPGKGFKRRLNDEYIDKEDT